MTNPKPSNKMTRSASSGVTLVTPTFSSSQPVKRIAIIAIVYRTNRLSSPLSLREPGGISMSTHAIAASSRKMAAKRKGSIVKAPASSPNAMSPVGTNERPGAAAQPTLKNRAPTKNRKPTAARS